METAKLDIRAKIDWEKGDALSGKARLIKAEFIRCLLYLGWDAPHLKNADFILRLVQDDEYAYINTDEEYDVLEMLATDIDGQFIYVTCFDNRLVLQVIPTIYSVEGDEIESLALSISHCSAGCREETDEEVISQAESISVFDIAASKKGIDEFVVEH